MRRTSAVLAAAPLLALAFAWLAPAARPAQAQQPLNPPSHAGFPYTIPGAGTVLISQPVIADLGLTPGFAQIVFGTKSGLLYVLQHNAGGTWSPAPGWPKSVGAHIASSPAVADLDADGIPEIVVGYGSNYDPTHQGGASAFRRDGTLMWSVATAPFSDGTNSWTHAPVYGTPAIGDVDGDGKLEVVFGSFDHHVYLVDAATGTAKPGWPVDVLDTVYSSPALYDVDGDGLPDIIIGTDDYQVNGGALRVLRYDGTSVAGFPRFIDQTINSTPVVADLDGDGKPEIIVGTGAFYAPPTYHPTHQVYAWHCDGTPLAGWPVAVDGQVGTTPAVADLNGDGNLEVVVTDDNTGPSNTFHVYAFQANGTLLWKTQPKDFNGSTLSLGEPVIADVLGDNHLEVLAPTNSEVVVLDHLGNQLTQGGPPYTNQKISFNTPTSLYNVVVGDLETDHADGKIEVVAISGTPFPTPTDVSVNVWNPPMSQGGSTYSDNAPPWGMFRHGIDRLGISPGAGSCNGGCSIKSTASHYFTVPPCRIVDTRCSSPMAGCGGVPNGVYGSPVLAGAVERSFVLAGQCGIPAGAKAVSANVTITGGSGAGFVTVGPGCIPQASTLNWASGQTRANNAVLSLDVGGAVTVKANTSVQLILDVNGFFQ
jgi:FG-GAP-like repeat